MIREHDRSSERVIEGEALVRGSRRSKGFGGLDEDGFDGRGEGGSRG